MAVWHPDGFQRGLSRGAGANSPWAGAARAEKNCLHYPTSLERARRGTPYFAVGFLAPMLPPRGGAVLILEQKSWRLEAAGCLLQAPQEAAERIQESVFGEGFIRWFITVFSFSQNFHRNWHFLPPQQAPWP